MATKTNIEGLALMAKRLRGMNQQDRMIEDKRKTLRSAIKSSYQSAKLQKLNMEKVDRGLINPNTTKMSYDDKILSIDTSYGYTVGDIFTWVNTSTKWLIYSQDLTELAYFKGKIRKCNYKISWEENQATYSTYAAVEGPLANTIESIIKMNTSIDIPNYQITILMPKSTTTLSYFKRYSKFYLGGLEDNICWRIVGVDSISTDGIIQIVAEEYYANKDEDDLENGIAGALIVHHIDKEDDLISGPDYIKPKQEATYVFKGEIPQDWSYDEDKPITVTIVDNTTLKVKWNKTYKGSFHIANGNCTKEIIVESLF